MSDCEGSPGGGHAAVARRGYDIGEEDGTLFIVMELVEGETLSDRLQRGPLYEHEVAALSASDHALKERSLIELQVKLSASHQQLGQTEDADLYFAAAVGGFERRIARGADDPSTKYYIATLYGLRGDVERAVRYLRESTAAMPALNRARAAADPDFDPVRADPAFMDALAVPPPS